jgi:hypothetical protein
VFEGMILVIVYEILWYDPHLYICFNLSKNENIYIYILLNSLMKLFEYFKINSSDYFN